MLQKKKPLTVFKFEEHPRGYAAAKIAADYLVLRGNSAVSMSVYREYLKKTFPQKWEALFMSSKARMSQLNSRGICFRYPFYGHWKLTDAQYKFMKKGKK